MITKTITAEVEFASFVYSINTGLALVVRFKFLDRGLPLGMDHYFVDCKNLTKILNYLNKDKTGLAKEIIDSSDLDKLYGKKAILLCDEQSEDCFFGKWIDL